MTRFGCLACGGNHPKDQACGTAPAPTEINDCARGHRAALVMVGTGYWHVCCDEDDDCWSGPWTCSHEEAVALWNKGMR